ncbi:hypothetical protein [Fusobacterium sp.]|uniref:autotransporter family protein n=1 Tax=Fusobacterium sp. TaxID=68766 RepID=UPI0026080CFD|nr:hypothetical protein [Fusobacterium sp.]
MITEIEKSLKRFLKRKATINQSFITKFLITGTIAFSLTACGGGGGGGSSSGNNNTPVPPINPENPIEKPTNKPIEDVIGQGDIKNQNIIINGNISNDNISNKPAISALNSIIDNKATIELSGEKTTALQGTANTLLKGKNIEFSVTNNKDITLTGKNQTGIKVISINGKITGINNGNITVVKNIEKDDWDANDKFNEKYIENFAYGMVGLGKDSTIINKGNISINGSAIGMYTREGIAVNDGNINIKNDIYTSEPDKENYKVPIGMVAGEKGSIATNNGTISGEGHELQGMFAYNGGTVINSKTGKIILSNDSASGLNGFSSTVINDGEIRLTNGGNGIEIFEGSATNNGKISINGDLYNRGIFSENGDATNSGNISIESNFSSGLYAGLDDNIKLKEISLINESTGNIVLKGESNIGIESHVSNSNLINKGNIQLDGNNSTGLYSHGENNNLNNSGTIKISGLIATGMKSSSENNSISNNKLINNGSIEIISNNIENNPNGVQHATGIYLGTNDGTASAINNGNIAMSGNKSVGIYAYNGTIENHKKISIIGNEGIGLYISNSGNANNNGDIYIKGNNAVAILSESNPGNPNGENNKENVLNKLKTSANNNGNITLIGKNNVGMTAENRGTIYNNGNITLTGENNIGMTATNGGTIYNNGDIALIGENNVGMTANKDSSIHNNGKINITSSKKSDSFSVGLGALSDNSKATNEKDGTIFIKGNNSNGIYASRGSNIVLTNNGNIEMNGDKNYGMYIENLNSNSSNIAINNGNINMIGYKNYGMFVENGGTIINEKNGTISVDGKDSYGMVARGGNSNAINKGTINIGASASGGMLADAGVISNEGIINIDKSHNLTDEEKNNFAMQAINGGTIKNFGTINTNGNITISSESNYIIGTTKDGNYGKISGENINLDGNITLDSTIASNDFKDTYILENIIESKNINLSENSKINSNSLLYDAHTEKNNSGNLDAKLTKNENSISDFTSKKYDHLASLFDKSIDNKEFRDTLSDEAKNVLNDVFASTNTKENIVKKFKEISGEEYSNISRQIFDIKDIFKSYDNSIIDTLNNYSFNFNFIGNYNDIESKNNILGYNSKMSGIIGTSKLSESLYGVLGYGYSNLDFDNNSEGSIQSIHTGIYKDLKLNSFDLRMGIFGEYNFHKIERNVANNIAKGDFNSYILGLTTEISQKFGDSLYLKPSLNFDLSYGKYDSFSESGAKGYNLNLDSQDYTSFIPALEIKAGKIFKSAEIYSAIKYGYEFGHMNKNQNITFKEFGHYYLDNDNIENSQTNINIGASFELKNVSLNAEFGKEFGHRDSEYIKAGFSYTF